MSAYQVGSSNRLTVFSNFSTLLNYEMDYYQASRRLQHGVSADGERHGRGPGYAFGGAPSISLSHPARGYQPNTPAAHNCTPAGAKSALLWAAAKALPAVKK